MTAHVVVDESIHWFGHARCDPCDWTGPRRVYGGVVRRDIERHDRFAHDEREPAR